MVANQKKNSNTTLLLIVMLLLGAGLMYVLASQFNIFEKKNSNDYARVDKINGLYVFIDSSPISEYTTIATFTGDNLADMYKKSGIGKDKAGQVAINIFNQINQNTDFSEVINKMVTDVTNSYKEANGVIFRDRMKQCEVIKFNQQ